MKLAKLILLAALTASVAGAADVSKVFPIKYADINKIGEVLRALASGNVVVTWSEDLHVIAMKGSEDVVNLLAEQIQRFDVPDAGPKNVQLTVWFLLGIQKSPATAAPVPGELGDVVAQLKKLFSYQELNMLDVLSVRSRGRSGRGDLSIEASSVLPRTVPLELPTGMHARSSVSIRSVAISMGDKGRIVHLDRLRAGLLLPDLQNNSMPSAWAGIQTDIDVAESQKVVIGRSNTTGPDQALFLVLTAKVVD